MPLRPRTADEVHAIHSQPDPVHGDRCLYKHEKISFTWQERSFYGARYNIIRHGLSEKNRAKWDETAECCKALFIQDQIKKGVMI